MKKIRVRVGPLRFEVREVPDDYPDPPKPAPPAPAKSTVSPPPTRTPLKCVHSGRTLLGTERNLLGLDHRKSWLECEHPELPGGSRFVCPCGICNERKCPGYSPGEES